MAPTRRKQMAKVVLKTEVVTLFLCVALTNMIMRMCCLVFGRKSVIIQSRREQEDSKEKKIGLASLTPLANDIFTISPGVHISSDTHNWLCPQWLREIEVQVQLVLTTL